MNPAEYFQQFLQNHNIKEANSVLKVIEKEQPKATFDEMINDAVAGKSVAFNQL